MSTPHSYQRFVKDPPLFGPIYWSVIHSLPFGFDEDEDLSVYPWSDIFMGICKSLPCGGCVVNCFRHHQALNFSVIKTRKNLFDFTVQFHNMVNAITGKDILTEKEAEENLLLLWKDVYGITHLNDVPTFFCREFFLVLYLGAIGSKKMVFEQITDSPDGVVKHKQELKATEEEKKEYISRVKTLMQISPMRKKIDMTGMEEIFKIHEEKLDYIIDARILILDLYNLIAPSYSVPQITLSELHQTVDHHLPQKTVLEVFKRNAELDKLRSQVRTLELEKTNEEKKMNQMLEKTNELKASSQKIEDSNELTYMISFYILLGVIISYMIFRVIIFKLNSVIPEQKHKKPLSIINTEYNRL